MVFGGVEEQVEGCLDLLVGAQSVLNGTPLIVVGGHDVAGEELLDTQFIKVEILGQVGLQPSKRATFSRFSSVLSLMASYLKLLASTRCLKSS